MKKRVVTSIVVGLVFAAVVASTSVTHASPNRTGACTGCHSINTSVVVGAIETANTGTVATYEISVSDTFKDATTGWAVFDGTTNIANGYGVGSVSVPVAKTYRVYGVAGNGGQGANSITISPVAPPPPPPAETSIVTVTVHSAADSAIAGAKVVLRNAATGQRFVAPTSASGSAQLTGLPLGTYSVSVSARGYRRAQTSLVVNEAEETLQVVLTRR